MDKNPWFAWSDRDYWFEKEKKRMLAFGYTPEQIEQHIKEKLEIEEAIEQEEKQRQQEIAEMYEKLPPAVKDVLAYEAEKYEKSLSLSMREVFASRCFITVFQYPGYLECALPSLSFFFLCCSRQYSLFCILVS